MGILIPRRVWVSVFNSNSTRDNRKYRADPMKVPVPLADWVYSQSIQLRN